MPNDEMKTEFVLFYYQISTIVERKSRIFVASLAKQ